MGAQQQAGWRYGLEFIADAPIACHEVDLHGRIVRVNEAECRLLGMPEREILGRSIWEFVPADEQPQGSAGAVAQVGAGLHLRRWLLSLTAGALDVVEGDCAGRDRGTAVIPV